ncbi:MAG: EF-P beta-lysylation protein EpmB [Gammaproteobacteria bacterium]|nr:EF-P beta-lysylation protein EpmB [Gammaproteobacteria bacterium]
MIPRSESIVQSDSSTDQWRKILQESTLPAAELLNRLGLDNHDIPLADTGLRQFPLRVPPAYLGQIQYADPDDPLLRQILPLAAEDRPTAGFGPDPVGDRQSQKRPGLLHKYHGRALLTLTGACAIHCRYCFRRHFPYADSTPTRKAWSGVLEYLRYDGTITEVIFSGGDPLSLPDTRLARLAADLERISHLKRLRIHSRMPVVLPERITPALIGWLTGLSLKPVLVVHVNHPREISAAAAEGLQALHAAGIHLLNQAVLLKGVNDSVATLAELSERLFANDVLPYYLHLPDAVDGAAHFNITDDKARELITNLRVILPGYLVPGLVREIAGAPYKLPLL